MTRIRLTTVCAGPAVTVLRAAVPPELHGRWCIILLRLANPATVAAMEFRGADDGAPAARIIVTRGELGTGIAPLLHFLHPSVDRMELLVGSERPRPGAAVVDFIPVPRPLAGTLLVLRRPLRFLDTLRHAEGSLAQRLRKALQLLAMRPAPDVDYQLWLRIFDPALLASLPASETEDRSPGIVACLFAGAPEAAPAAASRAALERQTLRPAAIITADSTQPATLRAQLDASSVAYVALVQAGDILPPHAFASVRRFLADHDWPDIVYADEDSLGADGRRVAPIFKPEPNLALMHSGTLARGLWVVRRSVLLGCSDDALCWAETARLDAWFRTYESGRARRTHRIPAVLASRLPDAEVAPHDRTARVVTEHLARAGLAATVEPGFPMHVTRRIAGSRPGKVSIVIPSRCRSDITIACIGAVLSGTRYDDVEVVVVIAQEQPPDAAQTAALARLAQHGRFRHVWLQSKTFNYSQANNYAVAQTSGQFVCLLNDDVKPCDETWLSTMVAFFDEPDIGIVGAKLYYPDMSIQHGGIIAGLAGLVEHVNRFLPRGAPGYASRAILNQEMSAVTGACMLVRRSLYDDLGGLDEAYAIAFNDVDFCFRARERGWGIVFAADAELIHFENFSFGPHYGGERSLQGEIDMERMQRRWSTLCQNDPFHNPNLSLQVGSEWTLAVPPRLPLPGLDVK